MLRNQEEDELKELLSQTYANHSYTDHQMQDLFASDQPHPAIKHFESTDSNSSEERSQNSIKREEDNSLIQENKVEEEQQISKLEKRQQLVVEQYARHIFDEFYEKINRNLRAESIQSVRSKFPLFLLSQPTYEIKDHFRAINIVFSGNLLRKNILVIDIGYCEQQKVFKVAAGTDQGSVSIFQLNSSKPQNFIDCFSKICTITCVKWSKNMQYLAISNDQKQMVVYSFKQAITIENNINYRLLKTPNQICSIGPKELKSIINDLYFINENPFKMMIVDENFNIFKLQMKKNFLNTRPFLTKLSTKFSPFVDLNFHSMKDESGVKGTLMAVSGQSHVTICQIQPNFEVALVYDKDKHGSNIKKIGFPNVSFRSQPHSVLIIWDKYLEIMSIDIQDFSPFKHRFSITHKYLFPDSTIIGGFLSNTFIYQVNRVGIKVYSAATIQKNITNRFQNNQIYFNKINYENFCYGERIEEFIANQSIDVSDLKFFKGLFKSTNRNLFYCSSKGIHLLNFNTLQQYISNLIQNNNWKVALQVLKDCYLGKINELDQIHIQSIQSKIKDLSSRYVSFLETIIISQPQDAGSKNNIEFLWNQQLIFIFNILITVDLDVFLLEDLMQRIKGIEPAYLSNITPFILMNRIDKVTQKGLQLLVDHINIDVISRLIFSLQIIHNDPELPHQVNNLLIRHELYLQFIDLNHKFKDYYTSIAVLVGIYLKLENQRQLDQFQAAEKKKNIGKLIAYAVHQILSAINFSKNNLEHNKQILRSILRLLVDEIFSILIRQQSGALFDNIIEQLYIGNCLQTLNQLQVLQLDGDLMKKVIDSISYEQVQMNRCEKRYWLAIFKLYSRRIIPGLKIFVGLRYLAIEDHIDRGYLERIVRKCDEQIEQQLSSLSKEALTQFYEALLFSHHIVLVIMVGNILKRYITTLDAMLADQSQKNAKIYSFIDSFIFKLPPQDIRLLRELLKRHIKFFASIDAKKTSDIICKYYLPDLNIFIDDLNDYPLEQLKLIRAVLELYSYDENLIDLKVRYLELLASNGYHDTILSELVKENYPLDESISICKRYEALQALAYLLAKSGGEGNTEAAIKVYFDLIQQKIQKLVVTMRGEVEKQDLEGIIIEYIAKCTKMCFQLDLKFHHHYDNEWFIILQNLQILKKSFARNWLLGNEICDFLIRTINKKAYPTFIQNLISEIQQDHIIAYLKSNIIKYDAQALQIIIEEMVKNYIYQKRIYIITEILLAQSESTLRAVLFKEQLKGFMTNSICSICSQKSSLLIHYGCGHQNHPSCSQDVKQCIICSRKIDKIYRKKIDNITGLRIDIYSYGIREDLSEVEKKIDWDQKMRRMKEYQQLTFIDF